MHRRGDSHENCEDGQRRSSCLNLFISLPAVHWSTVASDDILNYPDAGNDGYISRDNLWQDKRYIRRAVTSQDMGHSGGGVALTVTVSSVLQRVLADLISPPGRDHTMTQHPGSLFALFEQVCELADQSKPRKIVQFGAMSSGKAR